MRTTVGPLPPGVYWRRRAVVLGAVLLGIIVLFVAWPNGKGDKKTNGGRTAASNTASNTSGYPTPAPGSTPDGLDPSGPGAFVASPLGGPTLPNPVDTTPPGAGQPTQTGQPTQGNAGTGANTNVTVPAGTACTDAEMSVQPTLTTATVRRGGTVAISIIIKNIGTRTCSRDVGAGPQELYLQLGASPYWSSDICNRDSSSSVQVFAPNQSRTFNNSWDGRESTACNGTQANGPYPPAGVYDLRARLGTLRSEPAVKLTVTN